MFTYNLLYKQGGQNIITSQYNALHVNSTTYKTASTKNEND